MIDICHPGKELLSDKIDTKLDVKKKMVIMIMMLLRICKP
jgi:hypothetical protein